MEQLVLQVGILQIVIYGVMAKLQQLPLIYRLETTRLLLLQITIANLQEL